MISVIIPIHNSEKYLHQCVNSVLNQTHKNLEVILIDDGSTDLSPKICDGFAERDSRVIVVHQANSGVSSARNKGLDVASGEYITFVDSDDCLEPYIYEILLRLLQEKDADIAHCGYKRVSETGEVLKEVSGTHQVMEHSSVEAINHMLSGELYACSLWNKLFKRKLVRNIRFDQNLAINEDVLVAFLLFQNAKQTVFIDETLYHYRVYNGSACHTTEELKKIEDSLTATEAMIKNCKEPSIMQTLENRKYRCVSGLYSWYLFHKNEISKQENANLRAETKASYKKSK